MKHLRTTLVAGALALAAIAPATASAAPGGPSGQCGPDDVYVAQTPFGPLELAIGTHGGCISSTAQGALSTAAYVANCRELEREFDYPYAFYGVLPAKNRAACVRILRGLHTGQITPPPPPAA